jgi:hypothetical protein
MSWLIMCVLQTVLLGCNLHNEERWIGGTPGKYRHGEVKYESKSLV